MEYNLELRTICCSSEFEQRERQGHGRYPVESLQGTQSCAVPIHRWIHRRRKYLWSSYELPLALHLPVELLGTAAVDPDAELPDRVRRLAQPRPAVFD